MRICVFCGSSRGRGEKYADAARNLSRTLVERGVGLVFGGSNVGVMGVLADAALTAGGEVIGVIPQSMVDQEFAHPGLTELHVVADMHERKATMAALADGFITLPGGLGTLEELFEAWTWAQLGLHAKPVGLLDVDGYYLLLRQFIDHLVAEEFVLPERRDSLIVDDDPERLLDRIRDYTPPLVTCAPIDGAESDRRAG